MLALRLQATETEYAFALYSTTISYETCGFLHPNNRTGRLSYKALTHAKYVLAAQVLGVSAENSASFSRPLLNGYDLLLSPLCTCGMTMWFVHCALVHAHHGRQNLPAPSTTISLVFFSRAQGNEPGKRHLYVIWDFKMFLSALNRVEHF